MDFRKYSPMLAVPGSPFDSPDYLFEIKWDGIRAIALVDGQGTRLFSRNGNDITGRYPELDFGTALQQVPAVLDGEIVTLTNGLPNFHTLQTRDHLKDPKKIRAAVREIPAIYMVFDILHLNGKDLFHLPLHRRKEILFGAVKEGPHLVVSQHIIGAGKTFTELTRQKGLEGVMAKRLDSQYQPGKRSNFWLKFRNIKSMSCVICGYVGGSGSRSNLGSLILGAYQDQKLKYVGNAGSGLDNKEIVFLLDCFQRTALEHSPFSEPLPLKNPYYVEPNLVCEVSYLERTGVLRHPTFLGLRRDLNPRDCLWEQG